MKLSLVGAHVGLDDEHILAAHVLQDLDLDFAVGELADHRLAQRDAHVVRDLLCQLRIGVARKEHQGGFNHRSGPKDVHRGGVA
jgi:hypothetical protein